uniref:HGWP repeat containing protein-like n=1 Tax=Oryza sativa subsp. japonica TaxID=39947 RepID=Q6Z3B8_ORYSJ|nr:hypothetical protein [Oryza sativa Japonica Group]BAD31613.1 hypothetical protein [Oryza sativa Japonica Group]
MSSPTGLPSPPLTGVSACTAGLLCRHLLGVYVFTDRLAFVAADWCLRLHGWPIMPPLLGVYVFTAGSPSPPPTGVFACTNLYFIGPDVSAVAKGCYTAIDWITDIVIFINILSSLFNIAYSTAV